MPIIPFIEEKAGEMRAVFEDLHRHPQIGFEEQHASGVVAELLEKWGFDEVHTGIAKTGVVGILKGRNPGNRRVGLRADMDALPIDEISGVSYTSQNPGRMHACGHDGHTTMLLGAAQYLAETRNFEGTAVFVFQPAEEGLGGARGMIAEGLFERFPCDEIYGMHNQPMGTLGKALIRKGAAMAGASFFDIKLTGKGSHAAQPHNARDVLVIGADRLASCRPLCHATSRQRMPALYPARSFIPAAPTISCRKWQPSPAPSAISSSVSVSLRKAVSVKSVQVWLRVTVSRLMSIFATSLTSCATTMNSPTLIWRQRAMCWVKTM